MKKVTAIVLAAGVGSRMQSDVPKQFLEICEKPILYYSLKAFEDSIVNNVILVTNEAYQSYCKQHIVDKYQFAKVTSIVSGGKERYWSVLNGLKMCEETEVVLIHDAARPCITQRMINDSVQGVFEYHACTVGVPAKDTIKIVNEQNEGVDTPPRDKLWQIQTPQSFYYKELRSAYEKMICSGDSDMTDDTMIVERYLGKKVKVIMGDYSNIKVTTPDDIFIVENFLKKIEKSC